jgi:hypothetical protein
MSDIIRDGKQVNWVKIGNIEARRAARLAKTRQSDFIHGTLAGHMDHGCCCGDCLDRYDEYMKTVRSETGTPSKPRSSVKRSRRHH